MPHQGREHRSKKQGGTMKTRFGMLALAAVAVMGLSGCTTPLTNAQRLERFDVGESTVYVLVRGVNKNISKAQCPGKIEESLSEKGKQVFETTVCKNLDNLQIVGGFYWTHPRKGIQVISGYSPINLDVSPGDIVKISRNIAPDGALDAPMRVVGIARKASEVSKESGCYWEGGGMFTNAFVSGGVVCDGWDWKKQKFAQ